MGNDPVTLYFSGRTLVGYCDDQQCVDALAEKRKRKEEIPAYRPAAVAEVSAWDVYGRPAISGCGEELLPGEEPTTGDSPVVKKLLGKGILVAVRRVTLPENPEDRQITLTIPFEKFDEYGEGMENLDLYLEVSSNSTQITSEDLLSVEENYEFGSGFGCYPGFINVATTDPLADAAYDFMRLPVAQTAYTLTYQGWEHAKYDDVKSDTCGYQSQVNGAVCGTETQGTPAQVPIPDYYYDDGLGIKGEVSLTLEADLTNFSGNPKDYVYYLVIRLKGKERGE